MRIEGDGDCQFSAVLLLAGLDETPQMLRLRVVAWIMNQEARFKQWIPEDEWAEYLCGIADHEWGDHVSLQAMADILQVEIRVVSELGEQVVIPVGHPKECRTITLAYQVDWHYDAMVEAPASNLDVVDAGAVSVPVSILRVVKRFALSGVA